MEWKEFMSLIGQRIDQLSEREAIDFALNICNRLLPEYTFFQEKNNWGNWLLLAESIEYIEVNKDNPNPTQIRTLIDKLDLIIPDTEDFGDWDGSYALNASCSVVEALEYLLDKDLNHIKSISSLMIDTVDFKIAESTNNQIPEEEVWKHPLMVEEMKWQLETTK